MPGRCARRSRRGASGTLALDADVDDTKAMTTSGCFFPPASSRSRAIRWSSTGARRWSRMTTSTVRLSARMEEGRGRQSRPDASGRVAQYRAPQARSARTVITRNVYVHAANENGRTGVASSARRRTRLRFRADLPGSNLPVSSPSPIKAEDAPLCSTPRPFSPGEKSRSRPRVSSKLYQRRKRAPRLGEIRVRDGLSLSRFSKPGFCDQCRAQYRSLGRKPREIPWVGSVHRPVPVAASRSFSSSSASSASGRALPAFQRALPAHQRTGARQRGAGVKQASFRKGRALEGARAFSATACKVSEGDEQHAPPRRPHPARVSSRAGIRRLRAGDGKSGALARRAPRGRGDRCGEGDESSHAGGGGRDALFGLVGGRAGPRDRRVRFRKSWRISAACLPLLASLGRVRRRNRRLMKAQAKLDATILGIIHSAARGSRRPR